MSEKETKLMSTRNYNSSTAKSVLKRKFELKLLIKKTIVTCLRI
jgi:hypothetical protein